MEKTTEDLQAFQLMAQTYHANGPGPLHLRT